MNCPELNPDEAVWGYVKRNIARGMVQYKNYLKRLALSALRRLQELPNLVRAFFQQPAMLPLYVDSIF